MPGRAGLDPSAPPPAAGVAPGSPDSVACFQAFCASALSPEERAHLLIFVRSLQDTPDAKLAATAKMLDAHKMCLKRLALVGDLRLAAVVRAYETTQDADDLVESLDLIAQASGPMHFTNFYYRHEQARADTLPPSETMAATSTTFNAALGALATVRRTHAAHASALGALKRAFDAEMVRTGVLHQ
ncbi:hypothetical protein M885DRAFT_558091 [Pelagophyceae sp. CCMP2097]|nr:hypothetical protein M885DRAFT_558091 [Pelagophyceae sp. CCMP2097]